MANKPAIKTRLYSDWRIDQDYWDKLAPAEREYLLKFIDDYYHKLGEDSPERRDIITLTASQAACLLYPRQRSHYTPEDYMEDPCPRSAPTPKTRRSE